MAVLVFMCGASVAESAEQRPRDPVSRITSDSHTFGRNGNFVTYTRLKGLVPPATQRARQR